MICPRCHKAREPREKVVKKEGKSWLIEFCHVCNWNFEITEWGPHKRNEDPIQAKPAPKTKKRTLRSFFRDETVDEEE